MKQILLFGAGKSATVLIDYLLRNAANEGWELTIADANIEAARGKIGNSKFGKAVSFDIKDSEKRGQFIRSADLVISMLPAALHIAVAKDCLEYGRHLLTASYIDSDMRAMESAISDKGLLFLCEMGLDPGIDHMSAMQIIDKIHGEGGTVTAFRSHCGGLVAPESDDNPWHYKVSWNPRNIVLAGKAGAHYMENGKEVRQGYEDLFDASRTVEVPGAGPLSWYPNRDSLTYAPVYNLSNIATLVRTTLRHPDFMLGWKQVIDLKLTDEQPAYESDGKTLQALFQEHFQRFGFGESGALKNQGLTPSIVAEQLKYLGIDDNITLVNKGKICPADLLQFAVEKNLSLSPGDKDMIVMLHEFDYEVNRKQRSIKSSLVVKGDNNLFTAMAKTVGLPLGIAARLLLSGKLNLRGLHIPTTSEIYNPVLKELGENGIVFHEQEG